MSSDLVLAKHPQWPGPRGPLVLAILDGVGLGAGDEADAVRLARTPTLDRLWAPGVRAPLRAHGTAVGLPSDDDMGNSEVGHNALGAGVVHAQGALLVGRALASGALFEGATWRALVERCRRHRAALHFIGLLSDGNVHSHVDHLEAMLDGAARAGVGRLYVHALLDGRDVAPTSALTYVDRLERFLAGLRAGGVDARIASGGGRMVVTMDRYEADWRIVERGWRAHVHGDARRFPSATAAVEALRAEAPGIIDQDLPAFVIADGDRPVAPIVDGDAVVMFNFRGDRAIELSRAFDDDALAAFDRGRRPDVLYAGMMEYDGDLHVPRRYLVSPPQIERTMGELLARTGVTQLAISETQKYGHVTYFWNGNRSGMFDEATETYVEIPSDRVPFEERPWMKAAEITDRLIDELRTGRYRLARVNYANGDMVGHTGHLDAAVVAVETVDLQLARLRRAVDALGGVLVVTADHGNADEMYQRKKDGSIERDPRNGLPVAKTSHTLNPVPFTIHDPARGDRYELDPARAEGAGIASVTATCLELLGYAPPADYAPSLVRFR
ncbi:MAG: 2,3-bisphosphoglycerate-independent phosphoglycerate mutase [Kofleriaceae bacterium]|nr:2,3-bisphosphoglycerate-independent phosphoglycerate mutase [Kofleriaceae bacterium]MCL4226777.1 2,3-bisphosphoglycerate-independent phosphoglycerate mutase [Myxococcales bacterium]